MCKKEIISDKSKPEISPDVTAEACPENDKELVETSPEVDVVEVANQQQLNLTLSANDNIVEPESEMVGKTNPIASEDESTTVEQNKLEIEDILLGLRKLLEGQIARNQSQDEMLGITQTLSELRELFEEKIARNQDHIKMFDALYLEMKDYKEKSWLEVLHKPVIHSLIQLYDSFESLESQFEGILNRSTVVCSEELAQELPQFQKNLENIRCELDEALYRMDVIPYEDEPEILDKKLHRTLKVIPTDAHEKHQRIAEVHSKGFSWRDKVFRPAEVTIYRHEPSKVKSEDTDDEHTLGEEGDETDG